MIDINTIWTLGSPSHTPSHFLDVLGGGGKYSCGVAPFCGLKCSISGDFPFALSDPAPARLMKPALIGLLGISGLLVARGGDAVTVGALGELKCDLNGKSFVPPSVLNAIVRGVIGLSFCGPGVSGTGYLATVVSPVSSSWYVSNFAHRSAFSRCFSAYSSRCCLLGKQLYTAKRK